MLVVYRTIILIIFFTILVNTSSFATSNTLNSSILNNLVISMLTFCYPNHTTVVLYDSEDSNLAQSLWDLPLSIILHDYSAIISTIDIKQPNNVNFYIISFNSYNQFDETLWCLKHTHWWNIMATFLIVDRSNGSCENAENVLKSAWSFNVLTALFSCLDIDGKLMVFTYNPYTKKAPKPWKRVGVDNPLNTRWKVYQRLYHDNDDENCKNLDFDRTRPLDGYPMNITYILFYSNSSLLNANYDLSELNVRDTVSHDISIVLGALMDVNLSVQFYEYEFKNHDKIYYGLEKGHDFSFTDYPIHTIHNSTLLYPFLSLETVMIMQKRGYYTPLEKIKNYYGIVTIVSMVIIIMIVSVVIVISQHNQSLHFAVFEVLRLLIDSTLISKINTQPLRIFFFVIFIYSLIMHATLSGRLSAFLTKHELRKTPETSKDLRNSDIKRIYIPNGVSFDYSHPKLRNKVIFIDHYDCASVVVNDTAAVCLNNKLDLLTLSAEYDNLHVSSKPLGTDWRSLIARNDWPLKLRADMGMMWFLTFGFSKLLAIKYTEEIEDNMRRVNERSFVNHRPVSLADIHFAFIILAFGNLFSLIFFFSEIFVARVQTKFVVNSIV